MQINTKKEYSELKIEECNFSPRVENALKRAEISTLGELLKYSDQSLKALRCMGKLSYNEVLNVLDKYGLKLKKAEDILLEDGMNLHKLNLNKMTEITLCNIGIQNLNDLIAKSAEDLLETKLLSVTSVNSIREALLKFNLHLTKDKIKACDRCSEKFALEYSDNTRYCRICRAKLERIRNISDFDITLVGPEYSLHTKNNDDFTLLVNIKNNTEMLANVELIEFYLVIDNKQYSPDSFLEGYEFETESIMPFSSKGCAKKWNLLGKEYYRLCEEFYAIITIKNQNIKYMFKLIMKNDLWVIDDYFEEILPE